MVLLTAAFISGNNITLTAAKNQDGFRFLRKFRLFHTFLKNCIRYITFFSEVEHLSKNFHDLIHSVI